MGRIEEQYRTGSGGGSWGKLGEKVSKSHRIEGHGYFSYTFRDEADIPT
jgi:hypothetical protein